MAKRRRLDPIPTGTAPGTPLPDRDAPAPETKSLFPTFPNGVQPMRSMPVARQAGDSALQASADLLADELTRARAEGRLAVLLPPEVIDADYLIRDRMVMDGAEMEALTASLQQRGQQVPVEVIDLGPTALPRYGLISGWRRLTALRALGAAEVRAIIRPKGDSPSAYQAMVEENEVRAALSFYERARIVARATDAGVFPTDRDALWHLFQNAPRARRSKIGSFVRLVRALDGPGGPVLRFPAALSERQGLALVQALDREPALAVELRDLLQTSPAATPAAEAATIAILLKGIRQLHAAPADEPESIGLLDPVFPGGTPPAPGLELLVREDRLVLRGPVVQDEQFRAALTDWLRAGGWIV